ncbi:GNAT family N-acetyltransferase [Pseudactinotalea sp. Z1732]|uniref:GNAT family N-acetyltransferase n=1 Tax=Pseudactinotalea sp. Z1732 TaxID=3413026 RepID=UPI003C7CBCF6
MGGSPTPPAPPLTDLPAQWAQHPFVIGDRWRWHEARFLCATGALVVGMASRAGHHPGRARSITALGDPGAVAELVANRSEEVLHGFAPQSVSLPPGAWDLLPAALRDRWNLPRRGRWDWMWTEQVPPAHPLEDQVVPLEIPRHLEQIHAVQAVALPGTHFGPDRPGSTWFGIWRGAAELAAVAGSFDWVSAVHLGGIGTRPDLRGSGLGSALTAAITRAGVARFGRVSLGVYADNLRAKALYARIGYAVGHELDSRHVAA